MQNNISVSTILHKWKSSIEKAEAYSRYINQRQSNETIRSDDGYLCECNNPQSFGKNCEYLLPTGTTFLETLLWEIEMRAKNRWNMQIYSDIVCYTTLVCDSGLLCLDWRDICNGLQQCMSGYDEENCDKLEFNECEDDEYRCVNGMCIPDEYFLNGEFDCLDLSDENQPFDDTVCAFHGPRYDCDDRMCFRFGWSCGDGQCISNRLRFHVDPLGSCRSLRDHYHMCEMNHITNLWTLPNGKCYLRSDYTEILAKNRSDLDECVYLIKCILSNSMEKNCPCKNSFLCTINLENVCNSSTIRYPNGGTIAPFVFTYYNITRDWSEKISDVIEINGTIKCRGYMIDRHMILNYSSKMDLYELQAKMCYSASQIPVSLNIGYDRYCYNNSQTFNNRPYNFIDICNESKECISAYRINDGYFDCADRKDEYVDDPNLSTCLNIQRHRFRCSNEQPTCLRVTAVGDDYEICHNHHDELWMGTSLELSALECNRYDRLDCAFIRQYIETSQKIDTSNVSYIESNLTKISFHYYCDTFWDMKSKKDEDIKMCKKWWKCREDQWQCHTGQCIDIDWLLDQEWDCPDASDEEAIFALSNYNTTHNKRLVRIKQLVKAFDDLYSIQPFGEFCDLITEYPCFRANVSDPLNINHSKPCINLNQIGDGNIDCVGGLDERSKHPYSIRIEAYELNLNEKARLVAVWLYDIYFDFLPSFLLAKVLRFIEPGTSKNPCFSNPCKPQQECHQILNQNSTYVCLCPPNFKGNDCSIVDDMCKEDFCSRNALCKPNYRGLLDQNDRPYCICPTKQIGERCDLIHDICDLNSCQNDGTCFPLSGIHSYFCLFGMDTKSVNGTTEVNEKTVCTSVENLFGTRDEISLFRYHRLCIENVSLLCFVDNSYLCICDENHNRAECFNYDHNLDQCSSCFSGGQCLKDDPSSSTFLCLCPQCYTGKSCQFNNEGLSFTLDSILIEINHIVRILYLILTILIFLIGGIINYASIITFKRPVLRKTSIGFYILTVSIISQCSLFSLIMKIHLILFNVLMNDISCKIVSYLLSVTTQCSFWLMSVIAIERVSYLIFPFTTLFKKPNVAIIISSMILLIISIMNVHQLIFYMKDPNENNACVINFPFEIRIYNRINTLFHYIIPFAIQLLSITLLIILAARSRSRTAQNHDTFIIYLKRQFQTQKELYITPLVIILSGLPQAIFAFSFSCIKLISWQQHTLLIAYFLSYTPQLLGFFLFVLPSTNYMIEFRATSLSKTFLFRWIK
ncbi:unnamed protein product [Adineta steineri]|uniref:Uncharacterized protein n=1 Tax=Adineta steineri TaxID=433720 RepID=A0A819IBW2_9BILA|nr:unnamed protein product [Adineta steineri]CAF3915991.1 unnamed protein product [Adineta steineri]